MSTLAKKGLSGSASNALESLGKNLLIAITRRNMKRSEVAERAMISEPTLRAILKGDPSPSMGAYIAVIQVLGFEKALSDVASPDTDELGKALAIRALPKRVKPKEDQYGF